MCSADERCPHNYGYWDAVCARRSRRECLARAAGGGLARGGGASAGAARTETRDLMRQLELTTRNAGGRIYLAKDATMSAEGFAEMYPRLERFQTVLAEYDPAGRFESDMSRRLKIRTAS